MPSRFYSYKLTSHQNVVDLFSYNSASQILTQFNDCLIAFLKSLVFCNGHLFMYLQRITVHSTPGQFAKFQQIQRRTSQVTDRR